MLFGHFKLKNIHRWEQKEEKEEKENEKEEKEEQGEKEEKEDEESLSIRSQKYANLRLL